MLLTLAGWTGPKVVDAFGVREDTVRPWRSDFTNGGIEALKASVAPEPPPVKSETSNSHHDFLRSVVDCWRQ